MLPNLPADRFQHDCQRRLFVYMGYLKGTRRMVFICF